MATNTTTPNMSLINPTVGLEPGPQFASDISNDLVILDAHNHNLGSGVQITPSGLNINASLSLNNNILNGAQALNFTVQSGDAASQSIYMKGVDFWVTDGNGASFALTSMGAVLATSSGISSGSATAAFSAGVLVVDSNSLTPGNIQGGSLLLGNNVASSKFLTLSPPNAMGANYALTLPTLPGSTSFLSIDSSGNMAPSVAVAGGITSSNIAAGTIVASNIAAATITQDKQAVRSVSTFPGIGGVARSNQSGATSTINTTYTNVNNQNVALTCTGNAPVMVMFTPNFNTAGSFISTVTCQGCLFRIINSTTGTVLGTFKVADNTVNAYTWCVLDAAPNVGGNSYSVDYKVNSGTASLLDYITSAYEL